MNRRTFITSAAVSTLGFAAAVDAFAGKHLINKIGIQFFSLPKMLEKDLTGTLTMLSGMGYKEVELFGPYTFSTEAAKKSWSAVTPALGFSGSGYFGHTPSEMKKMLKDHGLSAPSMHTDLDTLMNNMPALADAAHQTGTEYVVLPAIPDNRRKTMDDYKKIADDFNKIGAEARKYGVKYAYHNHGYGLKEMNGQIPLYTILDNTDPSLVFLEMDLFWTTAGGADPVALFKKYKGRYRMMHVKDMSKKATFSGDGGDAGQWIELFPLMTTAGNGVLDLKTILTAAKESGMKHFIVEQDIVADPDVALKKSCDYLKAL